MIKVLVVDDQELVRHGIANLLKFHKDFQIVGEAAHGEEAFAMAKEFKPDIVLMDLRMPVLNGIEATRKILMHDSEIKILILTTFDDDELVLQSLAVGACGYLLKDTPSEQIAEAIRSVLAGNTLLGPEAAAKVAAYLSQAKPQSRKRNLHNLLTNREIEVLKLIGSGLNNKEIADNLHIAEGTVKNHVTHIFAQIGARDRIQAALIATQELGE